MQSIRPRPIRRAVAPAAIALLVLLAACVVAHRSTSGLSHTFTRPFPKFRTGRGISGYRCW